MRAPQPGCTSTNWTDFRECTTSTLPLFSGLLFDSLCSLQRDLSQLYEDAVRMGTGARAGEQASAAEVMNRAQRLLLSTGGFDVEAAAREAQLLQLKVCECVCVW